MDHTPFLIPPGERIRLAERATDAALGFDSEEAARTSLEADARTLAEHQDRLMAHETYGLLLLFQGMDASGKDEAITHVLASLDPRGCEFKHFKRLSEKEERHDFLWRAAAALPARGQIGIFNRSYYEQAVSERVHPERLEGQKLPAEAKEDVWAKRYRQINDFERYLVENGIYVLKFFLHVSKAEQRKRLLERLDSPETRWQFSPNDVAARSRWTDYHDAYDEALTQTNTEHAPWYIIPADRPWSTRAAVASVVIERLGSLHTDYPAFSPEEEEKMAEAREALENDTKPE